MPPQFSCSRRLFPPIFGTIDANFVVCRSLLRKFNFAAHPKPARRHPLHHWAAGLDLPSKQVPRAGRRCCSSPRLTAHALKRGGRPLTTINRICEFPCCSGPRWILIDNAGAQYAAATRAIRPVGWQGGCDPDQSCEAINPFCVFRALGERGCTVSLGSQYASPWCTPQ
jgi:hypothetical protein